MPWRGASEPGEFPTLGYLVGQWIEENLPIPDGPRRGHPYLLTDEMWRHLVWAYRLRPDAEPHPLYPRPADGFVFYGTQLRRSQKWGKDPFLAARICAHALGPVQFDGWDAAGEPVGREVDTPWIQCAATSDEQTDNTFRPIVRMLREGPLADTPGLDVGDTRVKLPNGDGWIEPVTTSAKSRLGAPITFAGFTEPHLMTARDGGLEMVRTMKRNLSGMGGSWMEATNAWDPSERSAAQLTAEARSPGVFIDHRLPDLPKVEDLTDDTAVRERIVLKYGDSSRAAGGWVDEMRILADIRAPETGEGQARRYFLDEIVVGEADAVDAIRWDGAARTDDPLTAGEPIALGFDGSRYLDATSLVACRIRDGRLFHLRTWAPPAAAEEPWQVPRLEVDQAVTNTFAAYTVWYMFADPHRWQDYLDVWAGRWPKKVVEFPTNVERRMDAAWLAFSTAFNAGERTHDGDPVLSEHAKNAAVAKGKRKPDREPGEPEFYLRVVKKKPGRLIDAFVAAVLSDAARGQAIEDGALVPEVVHPPATVRSEPGGSDRGFWRPTERLSI